jgi:UDP-sugar transporter A1/2/3
VIKYADNLTKGFSTSAAVLLASAASSLTFGYVPTRSFLVGTAVACSAFYLYFGPHNATLLAHAEAAERAAKTTAELESLNADDDVEAATFDHSPTTTSPNRTPGGRRRGRL